MAGSLRWQLEAGVLTLAGELDRETLLPVWQQRAALMQQAQSIDVAGLQRVDSAGLALLVHLHETARQQGGSPHFTGITDKLASLIALYNLQKIIVEKI